MRIIIIYVLSCLISIHAQNRIGTGAVKKLYQEHCMNCHGENLEGGLGGSLTDYADTSENFIRYVKQGNIDMGMPAFGEALSDPEIRTLQIYIEEMKHEKIRENTKLLLTDKKNTFNAGGYNFRMETVISNLSNPWSIAFIGHELSLIHI